MEISYGNYVMKPSPNTDDRFDLIKKVTRTNKETKEKYNDETTIGYSMSITECMRRIIYLKTKSRNKDKVLELKEYICEFKKTQEEVFEYFKQLNF